MGGAASFAEYASEAGTGGYASGAGAYAAAASFESCTVAGNLSTGGPGGRGAQVGQAAPFIFGPGGPGGMRLP